MKDTMNPCQHTLSDDVVYKEVVVIGNGPSGMVTSFMLAGNVPYLKEIPEDLPIDEMLRARLSNIPPGQSLYETDLMELAEGIEGRSQNPIPLLMDNLLRPCADLGIQADSLIEWRYDVEKQIDHVVVGRGPPGGAWHTFPPGVRTLSPGAWLSLPPHAAAGVGRLPARAVAKYCRRYVYACKLQRYFRSGVTVSSVTLVPRARGRVCPGSSCPLNARFQVSGYDRCEGRAFRYACGRVVVACGGGDRPNALEPRVRRHALHSLAAVERALLALDRDSGRGRGSGREHEHADGGGGGAAVRPEVREAAAAAAAAVLVVGSGVSAADAVRLALAAAARGRGDGTRPPRVAHVHRAPADALAKLPPQAYPDYCQVYKMMCDGSSANHPNYTSYPEHIIVEVTLETDTDIFQLNNEDIEEDAIRPKRVKLLNLVTNQITEITVSIIAVLIGSKPDLFFLQTNFDLNCIDVKRCIKCIEEAKSKTKMEENQKQCFLKNHWYYFKSVLGQSIQSCKSRYLNYTEINGNTDTKCDIPDCNRRNDKIKCTCNNMISKLENGSIKTIEDECKCDFITYTDQLENKIVCHCQPTNPYSSGIGFGIDPKKQVDCRSNPIAIDKSTHELLNAPKGMYALGPITADNFVRFIPGGALAAVAHMHKDKKVTAE